MKLLLLNFGFGEIILIALIYLVLFGSKNLPTVMKDLARFIYNIKESASNIYQDFDSKK